MSQTDDELDALARLYPIERGNPWAVEDIGDQSEEDAEWDENQIELAHIARGVRRLVEVTRETETHAALGVCGHEIEVAGADPIGVCIECGGLSTATGDGLDAQADHDEAFAQRCRESAASVRAMGGDASVIEGMAECAERRAVRLRGMARERGKAA